MRLRSISSSDEKGDDKIRDQISSSWTVADRVKYVEESQRKENKSYLTKVNFDEIGNSVVLSNQNKYANEDSVDVKGKLSTKIFIRT